MKTVFTIYITLVGFLVVPSLGVFFPGHKQEKTIEAPLSKEERDSARISKFLIELTNTRLMAMEAGKLAIERGTTEEVRSLGRLMVGEQAKMLERLRIIAAERGLTLPVTTDKQKAKSLDTLKQKTGKNFDRKFMRMMKTDYKKDIIRCKRIKKVNNEDINKFVNEYQPVMMLHVNHLKLLKSNYR
ncbi:MAG TPA: DUF4142 domain-containing protein [Bacteroidia bacterium]|nr:DUF4142 domain-containing protein [Bacteroidia bacterium]